MPNQHLAEDLREELGTEVATHEVKTDYADVVASSIHVMTFNDLFKNPQNKYIVENAFLIVDESHSFIEHPKGPELLKHSKLSFCTSATLGGDRGRQLIKYLIEEGGLAECNVD